MQNSVQNSVQVRITVIRKMTEKMTEKKHWNFIKLLLIVLKEIGVIPYLINQGLAHFWNGIEKNESVLELPHDL